MEILRSFPNVASQKQTVDLDGVSYKIRMIWRERCAAWYMDIFSRDDEALILGRKLTPGWDPLAGMTRTNLPPGIFVVLADVTRPDRTLTVSSLGTAALRLAYVPFAEIPVTEPDGTEPTITVTTEE